MTKNKKWLAIGAILAVVGLWAIQKIAQKPTDKKSSITQTEGSIYWTCPMHPQIHQDHPGECPICHMKLVKVSQQKQGSETGSEKRSSLQVSPSQLDLIGIQKQQVEKMTLTAKFPVSGRLLSASSVAFQVYESDLKYIRSGLVFTGEGSMPDENDVSGVIASVDSIVDPSSRTVRVIGSIQKGPNGLISETSFRGQIKIELKDRLAIPESSVLHTGQADLVYAIEDSRLIPKKVKLGMKSEGFYEVLSGVTEGESISSGPNFLIDSEAKIRGAND